MRLEILRKASDFSGLQALWEGLRLSHGQTNPYLSFAWQWSVYDHFYKEQGDLAIALAWDGNTLRGLLPLIRTKRSGALGVTVRQLQFLAHPTLAMTGLGAIGDAVAQAYLWRKGLAEIRRSLPHDELILTGLWTSPLGPRSMSPLDVNPVFDLPDDWDACFNAFSANKRKELRRRERELLKLGSLELEVATAPEAVSALFPTLVRLNQERFEIAGIQGGLSNKEFRGFHEALAPVLAAQGLVRLFMLRAAGEPIATLYVLLSGDKYCAYLGGHAAAFDKFGPGTLIDSFMIRHGITVDKVKAIDFGPGQQAYKLRFGPRLEPVLEYRATRATVVGAALAGHRALRSRLEAAWPAP